jgi:ATP-dependent Clp protease ATP-binding subunit ClpC
MEARLEVLLKEARGTDVVLFFDEVHTLMGAGGKEGTGDVASLIKPALARGEIRCIAATTDEEYHKFIRNDAALERRFLPIRLRALTARDTVRVLAMLREADAADGPVIPDAILDLIVDLMDRVLPNRHFPDKAIDLFDQVMAHARLREVTEVTATMVESVAERMAGIPASPGARLTRLAETLRADGGCPPDEIEAITERLSITLRGLDLQSDRPNLVADVEAPSLEQVRAFAGILAESLYGDRHRVLEIDGAALSSEAGLTTLIGASAGYVGYGDRHLLAGLGEQPCHVVLLHGVEQAHATVREFLAQGIDSGWVTDARRRRIGFSEAVVLRFRAAEPTRRVIGFTGGAPRAPERSVASTDGWRIDRTVQLGTGDSADAVLETLTRRWADGEGIRLTWTDGCRAWVADRAARASDLADLVDREIATPLWRILRGPGAPAGSAFRIDVVDGGLRADPIEGDG